MILFFIEQKIIKKNSEFYFKKSNLSLKTTKCVNTKEVKSYDDQKTIRNPNSH